MAGDESDEYMANPANLGIYDVNTVANYDPEIIPLLGATAGSAFAREGKNGEFVRVDGEGFDFVLVEGEYAMTDQWSIVLPEGQFKRRFEDGSLVIWRPGITAWIAVWNTDRGETPEVQLAGIRRRSSPARFDVREERGDGLTYFSYRLKEQYPVPGVYGFAIGRSAYVQTAVYIDTEADASLAYAFLRGMREYFAAEH